MARLDNLLRGIYFAGFGVELVVRAPHDRRRRQIPVTDRRVTRTEQALLAWLSFAMGVVPVALCATPWLDFANYRLSPRVKVGAGGLGTLLLAASVGLFWRGHRDLGANWSPSLEINSQQTLTTEGVYGVLRHPMYASQFLYSLAQALLLQNWIAGLAGLAAFIPMYLLRVPREEQMMLDHFGDAYRAYGERTGSILPRLRVSFRR